VAKKQPEATSFLRWRATLPPLDPPRSWAEIVEDAIDDMALEYIEGERAGAADTGQPMRDFETSKSSLLVRPVRAAKGV
jgi:hypothetical protein